MRDAISIVLSIALTLIAYQVGRLVNARHPSPLTSPVFIAPACIISLLAASGVDYAWYRHGTEIILDLLGPATAALALPLYKHRRIVAAYTLPALAGMACGALASFGAAVAMAIAMGFPALVVNSIAIKSVTTPIAVELAPLLGGDASLAAAFVVATGIIGGMLGSWLLDRLGVRDPLSRGVAFGTIAMGLGTVRATIEGELQGAVSGVAMGAAGVFVSLWAPTLIGVLASLT